MSVSPQRRLPAPRVSVVIPTYNRARYVAEALESVFAQTFKDYEVIIVDDGSTDNTQTALQPYMERIRYVRQENRGLAAARNRGVREVRGEFVAFLDSDDCWEPRMLEEVLKTFEKHPDVGAVFVAEREMDEQGNLLKRVHTKRSPGLFFTPESMVSKDTGVGCGRPPVVRRKWLDALGGFDESMRSAVDCEMWIRYSFHVPMVLQPEPFVRRRVHEGHLSGDRGVNAEHWLRILEKLKRERPEFVREHPWLYRRAVGKENLRLGRELLAKGSGDREHLRQAQRALGKAIRSYPFFLRAYFYLAWSHLFPSSYGTWRKWERKRT
jgi:glycosyltransferase involved in cell wall biosynthesis